MTVSDQTLKTTAAHLEQWQPTIEDYHEHPAISHSGLEIFRESPEFFRGFRDGRWPSKTRRAIEKSKPIHLAILEPEQFDARVTRIPESVLSTSGARAGAEWKAFAERHSGETLLKSDEYFAVDSIRRNSAAHPMAHLLSSRGWTEVSLKWSDHGLERKARLDRLVFDGETGEGYILDVKALASTDAESFAKLAWSLGYHRQQEFYRDALEAIGLPRLPFIFWCIQKEPAYTVAAYELGPDFTTAGIEQNAADLKRYAKCLESGFWHKPGWGLITRLAPPGYARFDGQYELPEADE